MALGAVAAGTAIGAKAPSARLSDPRACVGELYGSGDWDYWYGTGCRTRTPDEGVDAGGYDCSVNYRAPRLTRLTARILYEGRVQRVTTRTVDGSGIEGIGVAFSALGSQYAGGMPGGRYVCEFALGKERARIEFEGKGSLDPVRVPAACSTAMTSEHACDSFSPESFPIAPTHSVTCSAVLVGQQGRPVEIDVLRGESLLYAGKDTLRYPITSEWARTSAPKGKFLAEGDYRCRFLVGGRVVAERPFTIKR